MPVICPICGTDAGHIMTETCDHYRMYRCPDCTVEFAEPMRSCADDPRVAALYEGRIQMVGQYLGWYHREFLAVTGRQPGTLLDIGCGTGDFVRAACEHGYQAVGIDSDREAIEAGRLHHVGISLHCTAAEEFLRQDSGRYDVITFFEVLEHLQNPRGFLAAVRDHLTANGGVALSVPNNDSCLLRIYRKLTGMIDRPPHHLTRWSKRAIAYLLREQGFEVAKLAVLPPSFTDLIPDTCRIRLRRLRLEQRLRVGAALCQLLRWSDELAKRLIAEGRGTFVLARVAECMPKPEGGLRSLQGGTP
jgi:2-polyprenyl-3-methyl-5-hydroxy-6-metoxy-1,4-benzoquinol methylase